MSIVGKLIYALEEVIYRQPENIFKLTTIFNFQPSQIFENQFQENIFNRKKRSLREGKDIYYIWFHSISMMKACTMTHDIDKGVKRGDHAHEQQVG